MKETKDIVSDNQEIAYLWEDDATIDIVVNDKDKSFIEELVLFKCLKCETKIITGNENLINNFTDTVNGIEITCSTCGQKWFIHKPIKF